MDLAPAPASAPTLPVKAWSTPALIAVAAPTSLDDVADNEVAALVKLRLRLERLHAWWLLGAMSLALLSVLVVGAVVDSRFVFGAWATAVATGVVWLGAVTPWVQRAVFLRHATASGLSADVAEQLFVAAVDAAHWVSVLETCGHRPSQAELASFVRRESVDDDARPA
jgi:hypothetical protein